MPDRRGRDRGARSLRSAGLVPAPVRAAEGDPEMPADLIVVGGGLAGSEAAWQAARRGLRVELHEMKPERFSPAHRAPDLAELVCSNSLRAEAAHNAVGLLKEEMRRLGSLVMQAADATRVPAGRALAVDRVAFSKWITRAIEGHPGIRLVRRVVRALPEAPLAVLATGPLTAPELAGELEALLGEERLYFYDAISPTVWADSLDRSRIFRGTRYGEAGEGDYLNIPLDREAYRAFVTALLGAECVPLHPFERELYFEGCLPIEEMARRGPETLAHGPFKPVGLIDPRTGRRPFAVVQLRQEDRSGVLYNLVGCQTKLRIGEQRRVFRSLPGMERAVFARYGSVHRNTYVCAPRVLHPTLELRARPGLLLAGQMAGVEGYVESAALGLLAGVHAAFLARGELPPLPPPETAHAALLRHLLASRPERFQPSNVTFGLFPPLEEEGSRGPKRERHERMAARALAALAPYAAQVAPGEEP